MAAACYKVLTLSVVATAALTRYRAATGAGALPAAGGRVLGLADFDGAAGDRVSLGVLGTAIAEAGGAFAIDAALEVDAVGRLVAKNAGVTVARALAASSGAGAQVEVLLIPN